MDIHITCPYCNVKLVAYAEGQRARCKNNKCKGETKDYPLDIMSIIELNTKIKTKLQKYHEWAREERKEHIKDIGELELLKPIRIAKANIHHKENKIKELSTFISEVEKLAKDNGVELK